MGERMSGWVDGWIGVWMSGWVDGWIGVWMSGWVDGWIGVWMSGWVDGWVIGEWVCIFFCDRDYKVYAYNTLDVVTHCHPLTKCPSLFVTCFRKIRLNAATNKIEFFIPLGESNLRCVVLND